MEKTFEELIKEHFAAETLLWSDFTDADKITALFTQNLLKFAVKIREATVEEALDIAKSGFLVINGISNMSLDRIKVKEK